MSKPRLVVAVTLALSTFFVVGSVVMAMPISYWNDDAAPTITFERISVKPEQVNLTLAPGDPVDFNAAMIAGAEYLRKMQADITEDNAGNGNPDLPDDPDDGGWDWSSTVFTHSISPSPTNIYGATAQGVYYTYLETGDPALYTTLQDAADHMVAVGAGVIRSAGDMKFLLMFNDLYSAEVSPTTVYADAAKAKYDSRITDHGTAAAFAEYIRDFRAGSYPNGIIGWDIGIYSVIAQMLYDRYGGTYDVDADDIAEVLWQDSYNSNPGYFDIVADQGYDPGYGDVNFYWYNLGITGLIDAFSASGNHSDEVSGLVAILLESQTPGGGMSYQYGGNTGDEDWQTTGYAMLTLGVLDQATYQNEINRMGYWLGAVQDPASGGYVYSSGNHYSEECGEATAGLYYTSDVLSDVVIDPSFTSQVGVDAYNALHGTSLVWGYDAFSMIQAGIDAVNGSTVFIANGTYSEILTINKPLELTGESEAGVIINIPTTGGYGISVASSDVLMENFTLVANTTNENYPIHASGTSNPPDGFDNLTLQYITIQGSHRRTGFDIHGYTNVALSYLTSSDAWGGNGLQVTGCIDVTMDNITTSDNAWGSIAIYSSSPSYLNRGSDNVAIDGPSCSLGEGNLYNQDEFGLYNTNITVSGYGYLVRSGSTPGYDWYQETLGDALAFAAAVPGSYVFPIGGGDYYVGPGMSIQAAIDGALPGTVINVLPGTYYEPNIIVNKSVTLTGNPGDAGPGPGVDAPAIDGGSAPGDAFLIANGVSYVTIEGFEMRNFTSPSLDGIGNGISAWVASTSNITIRDNYFHHLGYNGVLVGNDGAAGDHTDWLITNNIIEEFGYIGFELTNTSNSSIEDNVIHLMTPYIGAIFSSARRSESGLTIRNNLIDGSPSTGYPVIYIYAYDLDMLNPNLNSVLIEGNTIATIGTPYQIYIRDIGTGTVTGVTVVNNSILSLKNLTSATLDASPNWWGDLDPSDQISGDVVYYPCWADAGMTILYAPVSNVTQSTYYGTIQAAIDAANPGDQLDLAAGTFAEGPQIHVDKSLSIVGQGAVTVTPIGNTGSSGDARGWWLVDAGVLLNLSNVTLDGTGFDVYQGIRSYGGGVYDNVVFQNIIHPDYSGVALAVFGAENVTISNSVFTNIGRVGALLFGAGLTDSYFLNNTYAGKGDGDWLDYAADISAGAVVTVDGCVITNCTGVASSDGSTSAGLLVSTYYGAGTTANISDCDISGCTTAVAVGYDGSDVSTVVAYHNNFTGNEYGLVVTGAGTANAEANWWGTISGSEIYAMTSGPVDFSPWCSDATHTDCTLTSGISLQPDAKLEKCGDQDTVWIPIEAGVTGVEAASFVLSYDAAYLSVVSVIEGAEFTGSMSLYSHDYGDSVLIDIGVLTGDFSGPGTLVGVVFTPIAETASTSISFVRSVLRDALNQDIYHTTAGATREIDCTLPSAPTDFAVLPGHEKVKLSWTNPTGGPSYVGVEVRRNPWAVGAYPEYDDFAAALGYPTTHLDGELVYQGTAESFVDSNNTTVMPRNAYFYTVFTYDNAGNYSVVTTDQQGRATNYWLGDVSGDGEVYYEDLMLFSNTYYETDGSSNYNNEFDFGPTYDGSPHGIPMTDNVVNFEDLAIFAINFNVVGPNLKTVPLFDDHSVSGPMALSLKTEAASVKAGDKLVVKVVLENNPGDLKAAWYVLSYDPDDLKLVNQEKCDALVHSSMPIFYDARGKEDGRIDISIALLGGQTTIAGSGALTELTFEVLGDGSSLEIAETDFRDATNEDIKVVKNGLSFASLTAIPDDYALSQNYPNPFNPTTNIGFALPAASKVTIEVFNITGQRVAVLVDGMVEAGEHAVSWNAEGQGSGVYLYRLTTDQFVQTKKMLLVK